MSDPSNEAAISADTILQQREKLASLGVLAAGLAHEINNPAAAAISAVQSLRRAHSKQQALAVALFSAQMTREQRDWLSHFVGQLTAGACLDSCLDPLAQSEREEALIDWLDAHEVQESWYLAPTFVSAGLEIVHLEAIAAKVPADALCNTLAWLEASLAVAGLLGEIESSTTRIATLVKAVKEYSYPDQAPQQEIDVQAGLESTLLMLGYRLKKANVTVERHYGEGLPGICAYGSELNQVWTNLIDNAIDALAEQEGPRKIEIVTRQEGDGVVVEIADNGPAIPPEIKGRIFEPFFTTKGVGKGSGLGLSIAYKIVAKRHKGEIQVSSVPGETRFTVRLPERSGT